MDKNKGAEAMVQNSQKGAIAGWSGVLVGLYFTHLAMWQVHRVAGARRLCSSALKPRHRHLLRRPAASCT